MVRVLYFQPAHVVLEKQGQGAEIRMRPNTRDCILLELLY